MLLLPVLFFGLLEGGLRLAGYGADYPLFEPLQRRPDLLVQSREVARRYFDREASVPNANADPFPAEKAEGTFRIFAMGESSAAGYPFYRGASFPHVLGTRLRLAYPGRSIEVVNTAMAAISSYTLLDLADEVIAQEPDAVVVYAGHNEWYGALGAASAESFGRNPALVRAYLGLRRFRTVQLLRDLVGKVQQATAGRQAGERPSTTLMARMVGEQEVTYGSDAFEAGLRQYRQNLGRLLARFEAASVPVYIGTLASNERDQRPFITVHQPGVDTSAWGNAVRDGLRRLEASDAVGAVRSLERATAMDTLAADGFFVLGHAYRAAGRLDDARAAFVRASDRDALRFRAPSVLNRIIHEEAARHGARVVDAQAALRRASPEGLIGRALMLEHLHPTLDGYSVVADAFFDAFVEDRRLGPQPPPTPPGRVVRLVTPMDSLAGLIRVAQLTTSWPFRPEEAQPLALDSARTPAFVAEQAEAVLGGANWLVAADRLAAFYEAAGRTAQALRTRRAMVQAFPYEPVAWVDLANLELALAQRSGRQERLPYVAGLYEQGLEQDSTDVRALAMLGALALQAGDRPRAIGYLEQAVRLGRDVSPAMYNLAGAYLMEGRRADARRLAERLVALDPANASYQRLLAGTR